MKIGQHLEAMTKTLEIPAQSAKRMYRGKQYHHAPTVEEVKAAQEQKEILSNAMRQAQNASPLFVSSMGNKNQYAQLQGPGSQAIGPDPFWSVFRINI